jgi:hypothetical protein
MPADACFSGPPPRRSRDDGAQNDAGTGTGLRNLRARLAHLYPSRHALDVGPADGLVRAHLTLEVEP